MIEQFVNTEILMEGDAITIVEETVYVESIVLFIEDGIEDTLIIEKNLTRTLRFETPLFFDINGKQTWLC